MTSLEIGAAFAAWLIGAAVSMGAITSMGESNPDTWDDTYSGDASLDMWCMILWPLFWPCWLAARFGAWIVWRKGGGA